MSKVYDRVLEFKRRYPKTIAWRLKSHCDIIDLHLGDDEEVIFGFAAQKNDNPLDVMTSAVIALTTKRIVIGRKRLLFGYFLTSITPDMFNDLTVKMGIIWGNVHIDTIKERVYLSNIQQEALPEIENAITSYMMEEKKKYIGKED